MNKPGLSVDTSPAVRAVLIQSECLYVASGNLHQSPVAENVAALIFAALELGAAADRVIESVGMNSEEVVNAVVNVPDDSAIIPEIVKLIRSKYA